MSLKSYISSIISKNNKQAQEIKEESQSRERAYTVGTVVTAGIGLVTSFMNPFFGIPMLTLSGAFHLGKKRNQNIADSSVKRFQGENNHLNNVLKNGLKTGYEVNEQRRQQIDKLEDIRKEQQNEWNRSLRNSNIANCIVCCSAAVAMFFGGVLLTAIPVAGLIYKNYADKKYAEAQRNLCHTCMKMNNTIYDHNITARINKENIMEHNRKVQSTTKTTNNTKTKQKETSNGKVDNMKEYSDADIRAVEEYIRSIDGINEKQKPVQKRKI